MKEDPKIVSYSRDKKGKIENYHTKEVANTIHCSTGTRGNTAQYVLEPKPIVEMNKYPSNHACGKVYNVGVSPTVMNNHGETVSIAEPFVVASRGIEPNVLTPKRTEEAKLLRKDYENHRINIQRKYMQQLEPRTDGVSNTITSVQKDNMLLEPLRIKANTREGFAEVEEYGAVNISQPSSCTRRGRVQGNKGDIIGTLLTGEENAVLEPKASVHPLSHKMEFKGARSLTSESPTLRATESKAVTCVWEPKAEEVRRVAEEVRRQPCGVTVDKDNNLRPYRQDKAKSGVAELQTEFAESVGSTLTSARPNNVYGDTFPYRIRRLIPRECFRLMDVDDEDYNKIKNYVKGHRKNGKPMYISESQQYKLAGNSIVVACMEHIFEQLFFPSGRVTEPRQLDIFDII
jgi:site-specific DNA-cytosine methylase